MTLEEVSIYSAVIGAMGAIIGGILVTIGSYFAQQTLLRSQTREYAFKDLLQKRLVALQNLVYAVDFIEGNDGKELEGLLSEMYHNIVKDNSCNISFFPEEIREDARKLIHKCYESFQSPKLEVYTDFSGDLIDSLKKRTLKIVDETYDQYTNS